VELKIQPRNIELIQQGEEYALKKFERLQRHLNSISDAKLEVSRTSDRSKTDRIVAQLTLTVKGGSLRAQERSSTPVRGHRRGSSRHGPPDKAVQGQGLQERAGSRGGASIRDLEYEGQEEKDPDFQDLPPPVVVRSKRFSMEPMTVDGAITQMELLSHEFFLFYNSESGEYNVVYRRHDGDYGIIEPVLT